MEIFLTGATGWIGSAVTDEVLAAGHSVTGLARSDASAAALAAKGVRSVRGSLDDVEVLRRAASGADAVIHLGFVHDFARFQESGRIERAAVETFAEALAGSDRPLLLASGMMSELDRPLTEDDASPHTSADSPRGGSEALALSYADRGVRAVGLRFSPTVHGAGDQGFSAVIAAVARRTGVSGYVDEGENRWPAVHRSDAARLVRLALEGAEAGTVVHAAAEEGIPTRDIAAAHAAALGVPTRSIPASEIDEHFGWIGRFWATDMPASSALTRQRLEWEPVGPTLFEDIADGVYLHPEPHSV